MEYIPYGEEWEKEMNKLSKKELIAFIKRIKTSTVTQVVEETAKCDKCGCTGNSSCGHEPLDKEECCTLKPSGICPCCAKLEEVIRDVEEKE